MVISTYTKRLSGSKVYLLYANSTIRSTDPGRRRSTTSRRAEDPHLKPKVRLRAQVLRLSGRGETIERIAAYTTGRSPASIGRGDLDRWEGRGLEGLADRTAAPGSPPRITEEVRSFMEEKLAPSGRGPATPRNSPRQSRRASGLG